jgi:hypothetical protein
MPDLFIQSTHCLWDWQSEIVKDESQHPKLGILIAQYLI